MNLRLSRPDYYSYSYCPDAFPESPSSILHPPSFPFIHSFHSSPTPRFTPTFTVKHTAGHGKDLASTFLTRLIFFFSTTLLSTCPFETVSDGP